MKQAIRFRLLLVLAAGIPRVLGAFFLPNTFGDAYVYIRDIGNLTIKIKTGTIALTDLYGFWLPLYQLVSAVINVLIGNGFYAGKIVSAAFGVSVSLLVYVLTMQLVQNQRAALLSFLLIAVNPLHILNSTSAMTDVPNACFVLGCLYFVLKRNWVVAALLALLAGLTRMESWMLIALIPAIQFWKERRIAILAVLIMMIAPLFWFYVSWKATGDWLACFKARQEYHDWLLTQNPALIQFSLAAVAKDVAMFISGADIAVLGGVCVAAWLVAKPLFKKSNRAKDPAADASTMVLPLLIVFFAFFALLILAYVTNQQPIIFPRYSLILFSLGIPILAWAYFAITRRRPKWSRKVLVALVLLCTANAAAQLTGGIGELNRYGAQRRVADYLRTHIDPNSNSKIFCDEGTVRALSGIRADRFITSSNLPKDDDEFWSALSASKVEWLVIARQPGSTPPQLFPQSEYGKPIGPYESVMETTSQFLPINVHVYVRVHRK